MVIRVINLGSSREKVIVTTVGTCYTMSLLYSMSLLSSGRTFVAFRKIQQCLVGPFNRNVKIFRYISLAYLKQKPCLFKFLKDLWLNTANNQLDLIMVAHAQY